MAFLLAMKKSKTILIFGAGKSATILIHYLLSKSTEKNWKLIIVDGNIEFAKEKANNHPNAVCLSLNIIEAQNRNSVIGNADIVISMVPPALHYLVAEDCLRLKKNLLTASYVDEKIKALESEIKKNHLLFLCEMGLDPGIDHMSAMRMIDAIHELNGTINSFKSHCGGLVAPENDNNPWHYKISWNPQHLVNAGKAGAVYKLEGQKLTKDYNAIFKNCDTVEIPNCGNLAYYPNRDSLAYERLYNLTSTTTFVRTTLRYPNFCKGWNYIIEAGLTDDNSTHILKNIEGRTFGEWFFACLNFYTKCRTFGDFLNKYVPVYDHQLINDLFDYLGFTSHDVIPCNLNSSAAILQHLLEIKLKLASDEKDMIVMLHEIEYQIKSKPQKVKSYLKVIGEDNQRTAMAKTVGLPLAIAAELILEDKISIKGLHIPIIKEIYEPVLRKLEENGITFRKN